MADDTIPFIKKCGKCLETKSSEAFYRQTAYRDGRAYVCKKCDLEKSRRRAKLIADRLTKTPIDPAILKPCISCGETKSIIMFYRNNWCADGYGNWCKKCAKEWARQNYYRTKNTNIGAPLDLTGTKRCGHCGIEKGKTLFAVCWGSKDALHSWCKECVNAKRAGIKKDVLTHYSDGNAAHCMCCGESRLGFLALDHINGGGGKERRRLKNIAGVSFMMRLKKLGFPSGYQTLCDNCNMGKSRYGHCPHTCTHETH